MNLIDKDKWIRILTKCIEIEEGRSGKATATRRERIATFKRVLETLQSQEPVKAHWEPVQADKADRTDTWQCSCCGRYVVMPAYYDYCEYEFCPNCGCPIEEGDE